MIRKSRKNSGNDKAAAAVQALFKSMLSEVRTASIKQHRLRRELEMPGMPTLQQWSSHNPATAVETEITITFPVSIVGTHHRQAEMQPAMEHLACMASIELPNSSPVIGQEFEYVQMQDGKVWACNGEYHIVVDLPRIMFETLFSPGARVQVELAGVAFDESHSD